MQAGTYEYGQGTLCAAVTTTALGVISNCERYNRICFSISGLTTETIGVVPSFDWSSQVAQGTFEANAMAPINCATGLPTATALLGNGTYMFVNTPWRALKFTKTSTVEAATIRYGILNAN
jgi:hypothetical protein